MLIKITSEEGRVVNYLEYTPGEVVVEDEYGANKLVHRPGTVVSRIFNKPNEEAHYDREIVLQKGQDSVEVSTETLGGEAEVYITVSIANKVVKGQSGKDLTLWVLNATPERAAPIRRKQREVTYEREKDNRPKKELKQKQMLR
jgi:hypothetical protein